jgi:putative nucleotidyltransferase with HDIG domain
MFLKSVKIICDSVLFSTALRKTAVSSPEWNYEKVVVFLRWVVITTGLAGLLFFISEKNHLFVNNTYFVGFIIATVLIHATLNVMFAKINWVIYRYTSFVCDVIFLTAFVYLAGDIIQRMQFAGGSEIILFLLFYPMLVLSNVLVLPRYSAVLSAFFVNSAILILFLSQNFIGHWIVFGFICVINLALGSISFFIKVPVVNNVTGELMTKEREIDDVYRELQMEIKKRFEKEKELLETTRKLTTVIQVTRALGSLDNLGNLFETIVVKAREEMDSQMAFLLLEKEGVLEVVYSTGVSRDVINALAGEGAPVKEKIAEVISGLTPVRLKLEEYPFLAEISDDIEIRNLFVVPLAAPHDNRALGALGVANLMSGGEYAGEHEDFLSILAVEAAMFIRQLKLKQDLEKSYFDLISALAQAIEAKDSYTRDHVHRVAEYARKLAQAFRLPPDEVRRIEKAAILHDIGKITTPEFILNKPGSLTGEERNLMRRHVVESRKMLSEITSGIDDKIRDYVEYHHERWDGKGYPRGLKGDEIPLGAQIIAVADTFDAMTSNRAYRKGYSDEAALVRLMKASGTQFNPKVLRMFFEMMSFDTETGKIEPDLNDTLECQIREKVVVKN